MTKDRYENDEPELSEADMLLQKLKGDGQTLTPVDVIVVDDIHANVFLIENMLIDTFTVRSVEKSEDFWQTLATHRPRLILLDLMMPYENGFEILEKLRKNEEYKHIPAIVVSAKDSREDVLKAMSLGAVDYIVKPVTENVLLAKICRALKIELDDAVDTRQEERK